ncbi:hypothetical protein RI367_006654 [Sorochytrium milnesiophthora]
MASSSSSTSPPLPDALASILPQQQPQGKDEQSSHLPIASPPSVRVPRRFAHALSPLHNAKIWGSLSRVSALGLQQQVADHATESDASATASSVQSTLAKLNTTTDGLTPTASALRQQSGIPNSARTGRRFSQLSLKPATSRGNPNNLSLMVGSVVKNRTGAVLARQTILKSDHFPTGINTSLDMHLQGSPNFRMVDLNVFGVAQPNVMGMATILTLLNCHPSHKDGSSALWVSTREEPVVYINYRPYVLRDEDAPLQNLRHFTGISAVRLEQMEARLRDDIRKEAQRYNGLVLVHDELTEGQVVPCWLAATIVQTPREVIESLQHDGYRVQYVRIPVAPEQSLEDKYLDEYVETLKNTPTSVALVVNCGMGGGRTTMGMVISLLIRRAQVMAEGEDDPFPLQMKVEGSVIDLSDLHEAELANKALLRLMYILEKGLESPMAPRSAIEWALARGSLIDQLKASVLGNYHVVLELARVLDHGLVTKRLLDLVIDRCDAVINLREDVLMNRVRHSVSGDGATLQRAVNGLERYFFLLAFAAYVDELGGSSHTENNSVSGSEDNIVGPQRCFDISFSAWLAGRPEISYMIETFRTTAHKLRLFRPIDDLSVLSGNTANMLGEHSEVGGHALVAKELEKYVIKNRSGRVLSVNMIMKVDFWGQEQDLKSSPVEHAARFRRIPGTRIYAVAQPTMQGMKNVWQRILDDFATELPDPDRKVNLAWINLREEPLIYINGIPVVLRDQYATLRNIKAYGGITSSRLELMEQRLKEDVVQELHQYDDKLLLHSETAEGEVVPVWEFVRPDDLLTLREVVRVLQREGEQLSFFRVPITAEAVPDESDLDCLIHILGEQDLANTAVILNCQVGLGRSTFGTIVACLVFRWLRPDLAAKVVEQYKVAEHDSNKVNYKAIHSLLRVIRNGLEVKRVVDMAIDRCAEFMNIRESIEECRLAAEGEQNEEVKSTLQRRGLSLLQRYFMLIVFQAYLNDVAPETLHSLERFHSWVTRHQEILTIKAELQSEDVNVLLPVEKQAPGDGIALTSEVMDVVDHRAGAVLGKHTILKHDAFPGCQKLSLPDRVQGAPNFRAVQLATLHEQFFKTMGLRKDASAEGATGMPNVCGVAMPTTEGIRNVLSKMDASAVGERKVLWTCLREEPVLYINSRPYVLRLFDSPLKNLEITGIARERVESMEQRMKDDAIDEVRRYGGRLLLHEEELKEGGGYAIVPVWETVKESDIQTPLDVFKAIQQEGFNVDYLRVPITDEQAPIPAVFDTLVNRVKSLQSPTDAIFNCQMGRGRTTTGQIVTCIVSLILGNQHDLVSALLSPFTPRLDEDEQHSFGLAPRASMTGNASKAASAASAAVRQRYLAGEYKIIMQLLAVLTYGKPAKRVVDLAIDRCAHMQNLREAILDYKIRVENTPTSSKSYSMYHEVGLNYLIRYFYLVTFAGYLIETVADSIADSATRRSKDSVPDDSDDDDDDDGGDQLNGPDEDGIPPAPRNRKNLAINPPANGAAAKHIDPAQLQVRFSDWLQERREITSLVKKSNQDFS